MVSWKDLWANARERSGISPITTKDDFYRVMSDAVKKDLNADDRVKEVLLAFLKPYAFSEYKSFQTYKWAAIIPATFVQWLSERNKEKVTLKDLEPPSITADDALNFAEDYSSSLFVQAQVRSFLIKFGKYLTSRYIISKDPFLGVEVNMPESERTLVYTSEMLDEFYDVILFGASTHIVLFFRLLIQTGLRPLHGYFITCSDIEDRPMKDALGRTFYVINILSVLRREKRKLKEEVEKKVPPDRVYISESLRNDILKWCSEQKPPQGYVFKDFSVLDSIGTFIERRRKSETIKPRLKFTVKYILYGLRHTWT